MNTNANFISINIIITTTEQTTKKNYASMVKTESIF
jgi:hypothetical protein